MNRNFLNVAPFRQPYTITEKLFSENIFLHTAENI